MGTVYGAGLAAVLQLKPLFASTFVTTTSIGALALVVLLLVGGKYILRHLARARSQSSGTADPRAQSNVPPGSGSPSTVVLKAPRGVKLVACGDTHIGGRAGNEDAFLVKSPMFVIADGMGGQAAGEDASAALIQAFDQVDPETADWFSAGILSANERMRALIIEDPSRKGFGTTVVAARSCDSKTMEVGWSGDSHFFRLRNGVLERLTEEHSLAVALWRNGTIQESEIATHRFRNMLHKYVGGTAKDPEWDSLKFDIEEGDIYLLCSDGLVDYSDLKRVQEILEDKHKSVEQKVADLLAMAVADHTKDNATAIVIEVK